MKVVIDRVLEAIRTRIPDADATLRTNPGPSDQHSILVKGDSIAAVMRLLRDEFSFDLLSNVTGVDWPDAAKAEAIAVTGEGEETPAENGFLEVVYHLFDTQGRRGPLVLRCRTRDRIEHTEIQSVVSVFKSAEFQEREVFDLFGVKFTGHPDLRRILMWDEFEDHPMRKDYVPPDDYEYEPTPHAEVMEKAARHYPENREA